MNGVTLCGNKTKLSGADLEHSIVKMIEQKLFSKKFLDDLVNEIIAMRAAYMETIADRDALQKRGDELTLEIERLADLAAKLPDTQEIVKKIGVREIERQELDRKLATTAMPPPALNPQRL